MKLMPCIHQGAGACSTLQAWVLGAVLALAPLAGRAADPVDGAPNPPARNCPPVAQHLTPEQVQVGMRNARDRGFLWRIAKDGRTSYLFGTIHVARLEWMFPGPTVIGALNASDTLALEMDLLDPDIQRRMSRQMAAAPDRPVPEPLKESLRRQAQAACLAPAALEALAPEMQLTTLSVLVARHDGLDPSYGIDLFLAGYGRGTRKTVVSLENPELQMRALRAPDPGELLDVLTQGLADLEADRVRPLLNRVAQVWADANHAELSRYETWCDCAKTDADRRSMKRLLDDRNPGLADRIAELHHSGKRVFAAVGSLHMIGTLGLPGLMAQRGFTVEAVEFGTRGSRSTSNPPAAAPQEEGR